MKMFHFKTVEAEKNLSSIMIKKKLLFNSEFSAMSSGYSVYTKNVLRRLQNNYGDLCEVAELASYAAPDDIRVHQSSWKVYPNIPPLSDKKMTEVYRSDPANEFNKWRFEPTLLDYQPDIIIDIRDYWYAAYELTSPFRRFYNLYWMTTVDSVPQADKWVSGFADLNGCLGYTEWATQVLSKHSNGKINILGTASPGGDYENYDILPNKESLKASLGLPHNSLVIGFVARNQARKLFTELISIFVRLLRNGTEDIKKNAYLYLHTCWPDLGWDLPRLLRDWGVSNRVYLTYRCQHCGNVAPSLYKGGLAICEKCNHKACRLVGSDNGISDKELNVIYNLFDVYCQYSCAEGLGMPQVDAAACGLPIVTVDYSGMVDIINKLGAFPVKVSSFSAEKEGSGRLFAIPDEDDCVDKLTQVLKMPSAIRRRIGFETRNKAKFEFSWDKTAAKWAEIIKSSPKKNWREPAKFLRKPNVNDLLTLRGVDNVTFLKWCYINVLGKPDWVGDYTYCKTLRDLDMGVLTPEQTSRHTPVINRETVIKEMVGYVDFYNEWEARRVGA